MHVAVVDGNDKVVDRWQDRFGFREASKTSLGLTDPYLGEVFHCVKAATSWTLRDRPEDGVEYYQNIVIPQPFEPNYDPLLAGIANIDLRSKDKPLFAQGVKPYGFDPVGWNDGVRMLVSNWRIDWSVPPAGGEYINNGKDIRRANWFLNRDPVLLRTEPGDGIFLFNQLDLAGNGASGLWVMRQLMTNLGVSLGQPTRFANDETLFD